MFCDEALITVKAGDGGNGIVSMRREKFIPHGGPDGGDGGKGGNIVFVVDANTHTLSNFRTKKMFKGNPGKHGGKKKMHGKNGATLFVKVPPGTLVYNEDKSGLLADLTEKGQEFTVVQGGRGGFGNAHFTSSTRRRPMFAEKGEPGEEKKVLLELKMIAEVGIIGFPSAGKSTLISRISNAKPKIAEYHFTTLVPNLGVVDLHRFFKGAQGSFLVADIPGLIEGASEGKGIGDTFLKHIQRTKVLVHMLDGAEEDLVERYSIIKNELKKYDECLSDRKEFVVLNKIDLFTNDIQSEKLKNLKKELKIKEIFPISAVSGEGIPELVSSVYKHLETVRAETHDEEPEHEIPVIRPLDEKLSKNFTITEEEKQDDKRIFTISGERLNQIAIMTNAENEEALSRFYDVLNKMGILKQLEKRGAEEGDLIKCNGLCIEYLNISTLRR